jgi:hypothetical protein
LVLNKAGDDIEMVRNVAWKEISLDNCIAFLNRCGIKYGCSGNKDELEGVVVQHIKAAPFKKAIASSHCNTGTRASTNKVTCSTTKPSFITKEGTFYHWVNVITLQAGQSHYMGT